MSKDLAYRFQEELYKFRSKNRGFRKEHIKAFACPHLINALTDLMRKNHPYNPDDKTQIVSFFDIETYPVLDLEYFELYFSIKH